MASAEAGCYLNLVRTLLLLLLLVCGCAEVQSRRPAPTMVSVQSREFAPAMVSDMRWWLSEPRVFERGDGWSLPVVLDLGGAPPPDAPVTYRIELDMMVAYQPVADNNPTVVRAVPVEGRALAIEQQVCFQTSPTSNGRYRVAVRLERSAGVMPGDYRVTLKRSVKNGVGSTIGQTHTITLH